MGSVGSAPNDWSFVPITNGFTIKKYIITISYIIQINPNIIKSMVFEFLNIKIDIALIQNKRANPRSP